MYMYVPIKLFDHGTKISETESLITRPLCNCHAFKAEVKWYVAHPRPLCNPHSPKAYHPRSSAASPPLPSKMMLRAKYLG